ncbi:MAG: hypothetical protein ACM37W_06240 [Actinomycetota bacterium]
MTDLEAIQDFLTTVRWAEKTQTLPQPQGKGHFLLVPPHSVLVPCSWESPAREEAIALAKEYNTLPGLILWGEPSESDFDLITDQLSREGFIIKWVGLENRIRHGIFMVKNLDSLAFWKW